MSPNDEAAANPSQQPDPSGLTGTYLLDARPVGLMFLSLTHAGTTVGGYAIWAEPNVEAGVEGELTTTRQAVEGTADGGVVVLTLGDWWNGQSVLTGREEGGNLVLTYPNDAGQVETAGFVPASPEEFNRALADWQAALATAASLMGVLPTDADVPPGLAASTPYGYAREEVAGLFGDQDEGSQRLSAWGWQATVTQGFSAESFPVPAGSPSGIGVTLHHFGYADGASAALDHLARGSLADGLDEVRIAPVSDEGRAFAGPIEPEGTLTMLYARAGLTVAALAAETPRGDPTPILAELARRVLDPTYRQTQAELAGTIPGLAAELADRIAELYDAAEQINGLVEQARTDLDSVRSAVDGVQTVLGELREEAGVRPMTCYQAGSVVGYTYDSQMTYQYDSVLGYQRSQYVATVDDLETALAEVEQSVEAARSAAEALDAALDVSPYPPPALDALPGDEQPAITAYEEAADAARTDLDALKTGYASALATADDLMVQGKTVSEEAQAVAACGTEPTEEARTADEAVRVEQAQGEAADIAALLPTQDDVPQGLVPVAGQERTLEEVAQNYSDPAETARRFAEWGWEGNSVRSFGPPDGRALPPEATASVYVSIHRFGSPPAASDALDHSFEDQAATTGGGEVPVEPLGERARALRTATADGNEVTLYVQVREVVVRLTAVSPASDPTADAVAVAETILAKVG